MKKVISTSVVLGALFIAGIANATTNPTGVPTYTKTGWNGEGFYFNLPGSNSGCGYGNWYEIPSTSAAYKEAVASILVALAQGNKLTLDQNGCTGAGNYGLVAAVGLGQQ